MIEPTVSIAIPTLHRGAVLVETIECLLSGGERNEIMIVDQNPRHPTEVTDQLSEWDARGRIRWIKRKRPSIPVAMNVALSEAVGEVVLFLDDDVIPTKGLVAAHAANYVDPQVVAVAGQVIQPWQSPTDLPRPKPRTGIWEDLDFPFYGTTRANVRNCMAGNLSVRRDAAIAAGGFDERFVGAAFRFETEFCRRLIQHSGKVVVFDPRASVRHLKVDTGGIRIYGEKIKSKSPEHHVGDYYFALLEGRGLERFTYILYRVFRLTRTKYLLRNPWMLPIHLLTQYRSIVLARKLYQDKLEHLEF